MLIRPSIRLAWRNASKAYAFRNANPLGHYYTSVVKKPDGNVSLFLLLSEQQWQCQSKLSPRRRRGPRSAPDAGKRSRTGKGWFKIIETCWMYNWMVPVDDSYTFALCLVRKLMQRGFQNGAEFFCRLPGSGDILWKLMFYEVKLVVFVVKLMAYKVKLIFHKAKLIVHQVTLMSY